MKMVEFALGMRRDCHAFHKSARNINAIRT
jgi:hypothetical protein